MDRRDRLPLEIESILPVEIVSRIYKYLPKYPKRTCSPSLQRELERLQKSPKRTAMDLYGLDDFVLK